MKITQEQQKEGQEFYQDLIAKAWEDSSFKEELLGNPKGAIEKFRGNEITLPDNIALVVEDQTDKSVVYLNIPAKPNFDELELTDEQLEVVSGGEVLVTAACLATLLMAGIMVGQAMR